MSNNNCNNEAAAEDAEFCHSTESNLEKNTLSLELYKIRKERDSYWSQVQQLRKECKRLEKELRGK